MVNFKLSCETNSTFCIYFATFCDAITGFPVKWHLRNERRRSILMTCHYPDLGGASDWSCCMGNLLQSVRSATQIWVVTHHQYGIFALFYQTSFAGKPVMASQNVGCFLRLNTCQFTKAMQRKSDVVHMHSLAFTFAFWIVGVYQSLMLVAWANNSIYNLNRTETTTFLKTRWP